MEKAYPKDLQTLRISLENASEIQNVLSDFDFPVIETETAKKITSMIFSALMENPSILLSDGNVIKPGYSEELDHWRNVHDNFSSILDEYLEEEKEATGIQNLKIRYNSMMGYYIEVTKGKLSDVPSHFILRRSLVNGERYTTKKLQELENELMNASEKILILEKQLFVELRTNLFQYLDYMFNFASIISYIDVVSCLAYSAQINGWNRPEIAENSVFEVKDGRHPVVEMHLDSGQFIPNSLNLSEKNFALITGPNMAGKSTFLRQNALITFLAQIGSFVPASHAKIGIADRIFCRVGASDNLARGESTFLVEMSETALILRSATKQSLVIMDEVGRGTSTEDGLSLAWAISEYLLNKIQCRTLFATHYHQLTRIEHNFLQNLCMDVIDDGEKIIFLRKVKDGSAQNSYGLHVALLAGLPKVVVDRAKQILESGVAYISCENACEVSESSSESPSSAGQNSAISSSEGQNTVISSSASDIQSFNAPSVKVPSFNKPSFTAPSLFSEEEIVLESILSTDVNSITPIEALSKIASWKKQLLP